MRHEGMYRRGFLGGTMAAVVGLAGCEEQATESKSTSHEATNRSNTSDGPQETVPPHDHSGEGRGGSSLAPDSITIDAFHQPASFIIYKREDEVKALDGRTQEERFSDKDARTVIQSAINALESGGTVFITSGTYLIGPQSIRPPTGTQIVGEGRGATTLKVKDGLNEATEDFHVIHVADYVDDVTIRDLEIDGNESNNREIPPYPESPFSHGIRIEPDEERPPEEAKPTNITVNNVYVHDTIRSNIGLTGRNCELENLWLENSATDHWLYAAGAEGCTIDGVHASGFARTEGIVFGVAERPVSNNTLSNVVIEDIEPTPIQNEPGGLAGRYPVRSVIIRPSSGNAYTNSIENLKIDISDAEFGQHIGIHGRNTQVSNLRYRGPLPAVDNPFVAVGPKARDTTLQEVTITFTDEGTGNCPSVINPAAPDFTAKDVRIDANTTTDVPAIHLTEGSRPVARATIRDVTAEVNGPVIQVNPGEYGVPGLYVENLHDVNNQGTVGIDQIDPIQVEIF